MEQVKKKFILSDESVNSYGFRVLTSGGDLSRFLKNPVMLHNHNENEVPGMWDDVKVEGVQLTGVTNFDMSDELAQKLASKVEKGFIKGASIGFAVLETSNDPALMLPGQTRPTVTKWMLYEASICPLPSNTNALALYSPTGERLGMDEEALQNCKLSIITKTKTTETMKLNAKTLTALNLQAEATAEQIDAAVESLAAKLKKLEDAETARKNEEAVKLKAKAEVLVQKAIDDKKLTADQKGAWVDMAVANYEQAEKALGSMTKVVSLNKNLQEGETDPKDTSKWTLNDWRKNDPDGLKELMVSNPEAYNKLVADFKAEQ